MCSVMHTQILFQTKDSAKEKRVNLKDNFFPRAQYIFNLSGATEARRAEEANILNIVELFWIQSSKLKS